MVEKNYRIGRKTPTPKKHKLETPANIPLIPIVGVNNCQPILHMSKIMVHCYTTG